MTKNVSKVKNRSVSLRMHDYFRSADLFAGVGATLSGISLILYIIFPTAFNGPVFQVVLNLSYSFLAAAIFYILQVIMPRIIRMKRAVKALSGSVVSLYYSLALADSLLTAFINADDEGVVCMPHLDNSFIYYDLFDGNFRTREYKNFMEYLKGLSKNMVSGLDRIRESSLYSDLPITLIDALENLRLEKFGMIVAIGDMYPDCKKYSSIKKDLSLLREYRNNLANFIINDKKVKVVPLTRDKKDRYLDELKGLGLSLELLQGNSVKRSIARSKRSPLD